MNTRMDRSKLNIGVYHLAEYARDERHVRELSECGVDFVVCMGNDRPALDLLHKYGVGAIVTGILPAWWGGDGDNAGQMAATCPLEKYEEAAASFADHPAIWGVDTGDEPSALDFPHYGKVTALVEEKFPKQFAYLNLYPNYASVAQNNARETVNQLGTATYQGHIDRYCQCVPLDYLCYDYYMYSAGVSGAYENLRIVADACRRSGRSLWIVLQVNSSFPEKWISLDQLRFQAYSAMAFGAENITWACYTAGWWHNQVLDDKGEKTQQYAKLQAMNRELHTLGEVYMRYRWVDTHFIGFTEPDALAGVRAEGVEQLDTGVFRGVQGVDGGHILAGQMVSRNGDGSQALFLCNADDPQDAASSAREITFRVDGRAVRAFGGQGRLPVARDGNGVCHITLPSCAGCLVVAR